LKLWLIHDVSAGFKPRFLSGQPAPIAALPDLDNEKTLWNVK